MPISASAKKSLRVADRKRVVNDARRKTMRETIKSVSKIAQSDKAAAKKKLSEAYKAIDKAVKRGVIKKNTASRRKARLSKLTK
jgi:small subunit ribosomal protein S20